VEETTPENTKRDLLEAYLPDSFDPETCNRLLDALSLLSQFAPEELQRVQVATLLLVLEELRSLRSSKGSSRVGSDGSEPEGPKYVGIDFLYFRELIMQELGVGTDDDTLETLAGLAGDPGRLERAIVYTRRVMQERGLESPIGFLIAKLRSWRQQDDQKRQRRWSR
jgi:hypothetical protein